MWRKGNPSALLVGMQTGAATVETICNFLKKLKMELPFDPATPLLGLYPKNPGTSIQKNLCTPMIIAVLFTIAKCWKPPLALSVFLALPSALRQRKLCFYGAHRVQAGPAG